MESDYAKVTATLPIGSPFTKTLQTQKVLVERAQAIAVQNGDGALVEGVFAHIFGNVTEVRVYLTPPDKRPISTSEFTRKWRGSVGMLPGLESLRFESDAGGPGRGAPIAIEMRHQDMASLESAGQDLARALSFYPGILDVDDGFAPGKKQIDFQVRPEARSLGLRSMEIARQVRHAYYGAEALRQQRGRNEVRVMVRLPKEERGSRFSLEEMVLVTPTGGEMLLRDAVDMQPGRAYTDINRREGRRIITVTADVRPRKRAGQILADVKADILPKLEAKYPGLTISFEGRQADRRESLESLFKGIGVVLIVIFAMLAVPLNSYIQPVIIMAAIPFGIVGAVLGHMIMGYALSVISMFGVLALIGVVINDSLVLIDMANRRRRNGLPAYAAILQAAPLRFRPILLTTLTTFGGLSPMIFETSRQARFLIPMAISLGFGVLVATFITLALVPAIYLIVEDLKGLAMRVSGKQPLELPVPSQQD